MNFTPDNHRPDNYRDTNFKQINNIENKCLHNFSNRSFIGKP